MKTTEKSSTPAVRLARAVVFGSGVLALLLLVILTFQLCAIWQHHAFYMTTGGEGFSVYGIWKVQEGHTLYEWPNQEFYQLTLYNFGFFHLYAFLLKAMNVGGAEILLWGRYLTTVFAVMGLLVQRRLMLALSGRVTDRWTHAAIWLVSFVTWFNSYFPGYYPVSVRPDMLAVTLSVAGVFCFIRFVTRQNLLWLCGAGLFWFAAWSVKQASVACLFGAGAYLLAFRRWKPLAMLSIGFATLAATVLVTGGEIYRWNILVAPSVNPLEPAEGLKRLGFGLAVSAFVWSFVLTLPWYVRLRKSEEANASLSMTARRFGPGGDLASFGALIFMIVFGGALSFAALCKNGSSLNQMFEVFVCASVLSFVLLFELAGRIQPDRVKIFSSGAGALFLAMCLFPTCQIAMNRMGPIVRANQETLRQKQAFSGFLQTVKKPLLICDDIFSLPWYSTGNRHPAIQIDPVYFRDAGPRGFLKGRGIEDLVRNHWLGALYIEKADQLYAVALAAGYRRIPLDEKWSHYINSAGKDVQNCELLVAPGP